MAFTHAFGVVHWLSTDTVGTTYTVNLPAGFDLKAIRFYHSGYASLTDSVTQTVTAQVGLGFATGTAARRALVNFYNDADTNNATGAGVRNDCVAMTVPASGAPLGLLDVSSFSAEQFVLRVDDQNTTSLTVAWEAWGGSDITVATVGDFGEPAATGVQSYSVTGFTAAGTDQVVMLAGNNITAALNTDQDAFGASIYCGYFTGSDSAQNVVAAISVLESDNADTYRTCQTGECVATMTPTAGGVSGRAIGNFAADAFELNWLGRSVTNRRSIFLAMKGGQWRAGAYTIDGATLNATATVSGLPFQPAGLDFIGTGQTQPAAGVSNALGRLSFGVAASTTSRQSMGVFAQDNSANSEISLAIEYDQALVHVTFGAVLSAYDLSAINSDGFTVIVDDAGGPSTEWQGYLAFAGAVAGDTVLAATPAAAAAATAALSTAIQFAGAAVSVAGASAGLGTQIPLQAAAVSVAAAGADLSASIRFNALAVAQAGASAGLDAAILLAMAAGAQASGNGDLSTEIRLLAAAQGNAAASAGFDAGTAALVADALSSASATALLDTQIRLAAAAQAAASGAAELTVEIRLAADAAAQAAGFADLTATIRLDALALVQAAASGELSAQIVLTADAAAQASATATFGTVLVFATPAVEFFVSAPARAWQIPPVTHFLIAA